MDRRAVLEELEAAFATLGPLVKGRMAAVAAAIHPDLRPAGWNVLRLVLASCRDAPDRPPTVSDIVAVTQMDKSVVSRQLRDLREWGLVRLERSREDARVVEVTATDAAIARHEEVRRAARRQYHELFGEWQEQDVAKLTELLGRLARSRLHTLD